MCRYLHWLVNHLVFIRNKEIKQLPTNEKSFNIWSRKQVIAKFNEDTVKYFTFIPTGDGKHFKVYGPCGQPIIH